MDPRLQRRVQRYGWDKAAEVYESFWANQLEPAQTRLLEMARLTAGERVLEVACGTGLVTFRAAQDVGPTGAIVATDLSDAMIEHINREATRRHLPTVTAHRADAEDAGGPEGAFDVALCALGLMYVVDPVNALRAMRRALKPNGRAVTAVWGKRSNCGWAEIFPIVERRVASEVCPLFFQLGNGDALHDAFIDAGFDDVQVERMATTLRYDTPEMACGAAFAGGPVALAYAHFDEPTRASAHTEYLESIAPFRNGNGYDVPGEFVIARGAVRAGL